MRKINKIILHCTATPEGRDYTVAQIRDWHVRNRRWNDIGYHFVVYRDGTVHRGRPVERAGAHTLGQNAHSIGICYVGGLDARTMKPKDTRTPAQKHALVKLVRQLRGQYGANITVHGHNEFAAKDCPSFRVNPEEFQ